MSTLRSSSSSNQVTSSTSVNAPDAEALSLPWDALFSNVKNDFDIANAIVDSILTVKDRCQITPFYIQAIIANSSVFLVSNTGDPDTLNLTHVGACWLLGTSTTCALTVGKATVDPCHAVIRHTPEKGFSIADVGSQAGTHLNRHRLVPQKMQSLRNGDMLELGDLVVEFFVDNFDRSEDLLEYDSAYTTYTGYEMDTDIETDAGK